MRNPSYRFAEAGQQTLGDFVTDPESRLGRLFSVLYVLDQSLNLRPRYSSHQVRNTSAGFHALFE
ncbi:unannotated protein [freshwater metagenome]|uniref:Unannotated protein n=1 Tax=freshwater metagenome TaxID=449393 RepID=A0A6J7SFP3_9ZZZZ